ncbi:MAG: hypothetical protein ACK5MA_08395 [Parachlamydiaceae bacterium]
MNEEIHHKLNDLSLKSGRLLQSKETRMLHYYYGKKEQEVDQTTPFYENLLFALALCRTKTVDGVQEAKSLLERLLAYQGDSGLLPVYLHEFPYYHDRYIGAHLLPCFYYLDHFFHPVLGIDLKKPIARLAEATKQVVAEMPLPLKAKAMGALVALGFEKPERFPEGKPDWTPHDMGDWLLGLALAKRPFPKELNWNGSISCFTGPWKGVQFESGKLAPTLYDLFMLRSTAALKPHPVWLQGALLLPREEAMNDPTPCQNYAIASLEAPNEGYSRGDYPFYIAWGSEGYSLALHPGELKQVKHKDSYLQIALGQLPPFDDKEKAREVILSISESSKPLIKVNGAPATTFKPGDCVEIDAKGAHLELRFEIEGKGTFLGHLSRGNRPTEWVNAGKDRFNAYEVQLALRSIEREENAHVVLHYRFTPVPG